MGDILSKAIEKQKLINLNHLKWKNFFKSGSSSEQAKKNIQQTNEGVWAIGGGTEVKLVVMGSGGVGKSSLTLQFVHNCFPDEYDPTIEDNFRKQVVVDEICQMLDILDTAGQEEFACMRDQWIRSGEGFMLVYSIDDRQSFEDIVDHKDFILRVKDAIKGPIVLVGNKCDLPHWERKVAYQEGRDLAISLGIHCFFESSAKMKVNVDECFHELVREVRRYANGQR